MGEEKGSWYKETDVNESSVKKTKKQKQNKCHVFFPMFFFCLSVILT